MAKLPEAKQFVGLHARHMGLKAGFIADCLSKIGSMDGEGPGSWVNEWSAKARIARDKGAFVAAANLYNLARFPAADSPAKRLAGQLCSQCFAQWMQEKNLGARRDIVVGDAQLTILFARAKTANAPLVILMGGIVSLKEQWGAFLKLGRKLGVAVAIADFPGMGENQLRYRRENAVLYGAIMNALQGECDTSNTMIVAPSFGGHLAVLHSLQDQRIRAIVTVGAPLRAFFLEPKAVVAMPEITRYALSIAMGCDEAAVGEKLAKLALSPDELSRVPVPVHYVAALEDEIIPPAEWQDAQKLMPQLHLHAFHDVHGAPNHLKETRLLILSLLLKHGGKPLLGHFVSKILAVRLRKASRRKHHS